MTNILKIILIIVSLFTITLILLSLYYPVLINQSETFIKIKRDYNNSKEVISNGKQLAYYENGYTFEKYYSEIYKKYEFVFTKINPLNPVVTLIAEEKDGTSSYNVLSLKRVGLNDFDYDSQIGASLKNKTFEQAVEIAKKYDLTKENPDPANITVYLAPTKEEVETSKQSEIKRNLVLEDYKRFDALPKEKKIEELKAKIKVIDDCFALVNNKVAEVTNRVKKTSSDTDVILRTLEKEVYTQKFCDKSLITLRGKTDEYFRMDNDKYDMEVTLKELEK